MKLKFIIGVVGILSACGFTNAPSLDTTQEEQDNKELLISFEGKYPGATTSENVERIITDFKKKQKRNQTLNWLKNQKQENAQDIEADDELDK